ncbi:kinase-like domain-containing protein, partial [Rhizophagus irregularis DAOM 181602=DAOM 197198]
DGPLYKKDQLNNYTRDSNKEVALKCLHNSQESIDSLINEAKKYPTKHEAFQILYGISQNPDTGNYIFVLIWTSGNEKIDDFIQERQLQINDYNDVVFEWILYSQFNDIKEIGKGGFSTVYSAEWRDGPLEYDVDKKIYNRNPNKVIALKCLHNSQSITDKFLNEVKEYSINKSSNILNVYGISQNPDTKEYIMVLQYAKEGNFNHWINKNYEYFNWKDKLSALIDIINGLKEIHQRNLVHRDFHTGNILFLNFINHFSNCVLISDMGLSGEVDNIDETKIYGVMSYVAPEVLRGKPYTQAADIYSFGMIMYFVATGKQPFGNRAHDYDLALDICKGVRPEINKSEVPRCYFDLMKKCWDLDKNNRPDVFELDKLIKSFYGLYVEDLVIFGNEEIKIQFEETEEYRKTNFSPTENYQTVTHPQAIYTSRLLNHITKELPKNEDDYNSQSLDYCALPIRNDIQ